MFGIGVAEGDLWSALLGPRSRCLDPMETEQSAPGGFESFLWLGFIKAGTVCIADSIFFLWSCRVMVPRGLFSWWLDAECYAANRMAAVGRGIKRR